MLLTSILSYLSMAVTGQQHYYLTVYILFLVLAYWLLYITLFTQSIELISSMDVALPNFLNHWHTKKTKIHNFAFDFYDLLLWHGTRYC